MRVDLHCHTCHSPDSLLTLDRLIRQMDRRGIDVVAITDHNTLSGALEYHAPVSYTHLTLPTNREV